MSEIGFTITPTASVSPEQLATLRHHYLTYVRSTGRDVSRLHADLDAVYGTIDALARAGRLSDVVRRLHDCEHAVLFSTDASALSLREFQQEMLAEGRVVRLVTESSLERNGVRALGPDDLLVVVTTSGEFARRQRPLIDASGAHKVLVSATAAEDAHAPFDDVLLIGNGCSEGSSLHRIYATYGVTYLFDCLFGLYALTYDDEL